MQEPGRRRRLEQKQRGAFFTPDAVARRLIAAAREEIEALGHQLPPGAILDPACGDGAFLRAADALDPRRDRERHGVDIDPDSVAAASPWGRVSVGDGLRTPQEERAYAAVVGNPPFASDHLRRCGDAALLEVQRLLPIAGCDSLGRPGPPLPVSRLRTFNIATLFAERFLRLARRGALVVVVLPVSFLGNTKDEGHRHYLLRRARLLSIEVLPAGTFQGEGTAAATTALTMLRRDEDLEDLARAEDEPVRLRSPSVVATVVPCGALLRARRWDPEFLVTEAEDPLATCHLPVEGLEAFIEHLSYGGIATGRRPQTPGPVHYVTQRAVGEGGIDLSGCPRIVDAPPFVTDRVRLRPGDLVVPRCGAGTLAKNRLTRFDHDVDAVVDCFCDLLRLRGISSAWALGFLRSEAGWAQIRRRIHGVGTPNLSFAGIRALRVPVPTTTQAVEAERLWGGVRTGALPFDALRTYVHTTTFGVGPAPSASPEIRIARRRRPTGGT